MRSNRSGTVLFAGLLLGAAAIWACGSSSEDENGAGDGNAEAKKFFAEKVHTPLSTACNQCHQTGKSGAPVFLGANAEASYKAIEGFPGLLSAPSISPLVQKGVHSGPALNQVQTDLVSQWLKLEVTSRKLGADPGVPRNLRAAFKAFGQCMDYNRWVELKLDKIALLDTENNQGKCLSCHNTGQGSMWFSASPEETFLKMKEFPYVQRLVVGKVNAAGSFDGIEASRRILDKGTEAQQPQSNSHPRYALLSETSTNLTQFVLETISNVAANRCQNVSLPDGGPDAAK